MTRTRHDVSIQSRINTIPWQTGVYQTHGLSLAQVQKAVWWIAGPKRYGAHRAIVQAMMTCGPVYSFIAHVIDFWPFCWCSALAYRLIANNRARLPGVKPACIDGKFDCAKAHELV